MYMYQTYGYYRVSPFFLFSFCRASAPPLTRFIVFQSGNGEIRLLNPSQPPRRHAATGHAAQADKRDTSAPPLLSTRQINKIRAWCAQTRSPRVEVMQHWAGEVPLYFLCGSDFFYFFQVFSLWIYLRGFYPRKKHYTQLYFLTRVLASPSSLYVAH